MCSHRDLAVQAFIRETRSHVIISEAPLRSSLKWALIPHGDSGHRNSDPEEFLRSRSSKVSIVQEGNQEPKRTELGETVQIPGVCGSRQTQTTGARKEI